MMKYYRKKNYTKDEFALTQTSELGITVFLISVHLSYKVGKYMGTFLKACV